MKKKYFTIGIILCLFVSCKKDTIHYLDHSKWFIYEENDTLIFKSGSLADTFRINQVVNRHLDIDKKMGDEILWVDYEGVSGCQNCPIYSFRRDYQMVSFMGKLYSGVIYYENTVPIEYALGDTILLNIYVDDNIPTEDTIHFQVKAIYYSDIYGVIRYDMYDDRVYELQLE